MKGFQLVCSSIVIGSLAFSSAAYAAVYDFGSLLTASSGYTAPNSFGSNPFAQLSASDTDSGNWDFNMYVHVQGIGEDYSAKHTPVPVSSVPEPEAYAMLLAGLAIIGFNARRRKNKQEQFFA